MMDADTFLERARAAAERSEYGQDAPDEPAFYAKWITGGMAGGNCWEGVAGPVDPEPEPELAGLMDFLEEMGVTPRHALAIVGGTVAGGYEERGHYGNVLRYASKAITVSRLHATMSGLGYVEPPPGADAP